MSRCFPFPPPEYEPKARTGIIDLLAKEKHREKKHKKEKREHKEKRDKDRSKDKRKGKYQKHKDRKKENGRDKGRTSEDIKAEVLSQGHNEDSQFEEELGKRTRDDWAENPIVGNFTNSIQKKFEGVDAASASLEKERVAAQVASVQRRNDSNGLPIENVAISQRRVECTSTATAMEKERRNKMHGCVTSETALEKETGKMREKVAVGSGGTNESRKNGVSRSMESVSGLSTRKTEGSTAGMKKEKCGERSLVSNSVVPGLERGKLGTKVLALSSLAAAQRRKDVLGMSFDNLSSISGKTEFVGTHSLYSRIEGVDSVLTIEKERTTGGELFQVGQAVEKNTYKKVAEDKKGHKDGDHSVKKSKAKDINRLTKEKKKEENIVENAEDIEHNKLRNIGKKIQADILNSKPLAPPHKDNAIGIVCFEGTTKKRKYLDTNGYLQENDERSNKITRMISFSQNLVNGRSLELHHTAPCSILLKSGAINNLRTDRLLENNEIKITGNATSQLSPLELKPPVSAVFTKNSDVSYLSQIYTVPKMAELPEIDDQDWLFHCYDSLQMSKIDLKAEKIPLVFAEALRIESADVLALPYVVPF